MMYVNWEAYDEPRTMKDATPATMDDIQRLQERCKMMSGRHFVYIPAFSVIDGNLVFYVSGSWDC